MKSDPFYLVMLTIFVIITIIFIQFSNQYIFINLATVLFVLGRINQCKFDCCCEG